MFWTLRYFAEATPYYDEPTEFIDPGYYLVGHHPGDEVEAPRVVLKVLEAVDEEGADSRREIALEVIAILNAAPSLVN